MEDFVFIVEFDLQRLPMFGENHLYPMCVFDTFEGAEKYVDMVFEDNKEKMMEGTEDDDISFEENTHKWGKKEFDTGECGYCYTKQLIAKDEIRSIANLQVSVIRITYYKN